MDIFKIKNLIKANGEKFIFLENGEPEIVAMSFKEYERLLGMQGQKENPVFEPIVTSEDLVSSQGGAGVRATESQYHRGENYPSHGSAHRERFPMTVAESIGLPSNTTSAVPASSRNRHEMAEVDILGLPVRPEDIRLEDLPI